MRAAMDLASVGELSAEREMHHGGHFGGDFVGNDRDDAASAECDEWKSDGVVAAQDDEIFRHLIEDGGHLPDVARSFLDADDVGDLCQARDGGGFDVDAGAALHAVENDGQIDGAGDGFEMLIEAFLRGLVVIRGDGEDALDAEGGEFAGERNYFCGVVTACSAEDWNFARSFFYRDGDYAEMFLVREGGAFAGGAAGDEEVDTAGDLALDELAQC